MNPVDIVIFSEDFPPKDGGIAQWAMGVARSFHKLGLRVHLLTRFWNENFQRIQEKEPYRLVQVKGKNWKRFRSIYATKALRKLLDDGLKPKVIIATTSNIARGLVGLAKSSQSELVIIVHGLEVTRKMSWFKHQVIKRTLNASHLVVAVSRFTASVVEERYQVPANRIKVLPNGVDPDLFYPEEPAEAYKQELAIERKKVILTLARLQERKGHDKVIEALPEVLKNVPDAIYLVSGKKEGEYYERLKMLVQRLDLENAVRFVGYIPSDELNRLYNACDVYIMPSRELENSGDTEGFGITYLEANACGKPVIGGRSGGVVDAIDDGVNGFLVDPKSADEIASRLIQLLSDNALAERIGAQARARVLERFTWDAIGKNLAQELGLD